MIPILILSRKNEWTKEWLLIALCCDGYNNTKRQYLKPKLLKSYATKEIYKELKIKLRF